MPPLNLLPMHLMLAMYGWSTLQNALRSANPASPPWSLWQQDRVAAETMPQGMMAPGMMAAALANPDLQRAVEAEIAARSQKLLRGINAYLTHPYRRVTCDAHVFWRKDRVRLLDYSPPEAAHGNAPVVLFIPSLINRYYILDLLPQSSLLKHLSAAGMRPMVIDWDAPEASMAALRCADYVERYLFEALEAVRRSTRGPVILAGYCMGGLLAMALAQHRMREINGLILLATPWDFHAAGVTRLVPDEARLALLSGVIAQQDIVPAEAVQASFYSQDPWRFHEKFQHFSTLPPGSVEAELFVALEQWVNDGVPLTRAVAQECVEDWSWRNRPALGEWHIGGGCTLAPHRLDLPALLVAAQRDAIVPRDCALPLSALLPRVTRLQPSCGHVGMVAGMHAATQLYRPMTQWIEAQF